MTETSGYAEEWLANGSTPGVLDLGIAIGSALKYGKASAWVFYQGSYTGCPEDPTEVPTQDADDL